jgi:hypothetical protein
MKVWLVWWQFWLTVYGVEGIGWFFRILFYLLLWSIQKPLRLLMNFCFVPDRRRMLYVVLNGETLLVANLGRPLVWDFLRLIRMHLLIEWLISLDWSVLLEILRVRFWVWNAVRVRWKWILLWRRLYRLFMLFFFVRKQALEISFFKVMVYGWSKR